MAIGIKRISIALLIVICCVRAERCYSQSDSSSIQFSGYMETYYSYDLGQPSDHSRPGFIYSYNRHNEVNLNMGFIKTNYQSAKIRSNLAIMAGTYVNANLAAEPGVLKNIFEANVGIKLFRKNNLWLDAGIFPSHIGFESAIGKDCWTLTRSLLAENSPYYEAGAKVTYTTQDGRWTLSGLILNGWQRIQRVDGNNSPSFGHQLTYKASPSILLNSSSFIGNDKADSVKQIRYFHNFYGQFQLTPHLGLLLGLDYGWQQVSKGSKMYDHWFTPIMIVKLAAGNKTSLAARIEHFNDAKEVIVSTGTTHGFQTWGYSINVDRKLNDNAVWRVEARMFNSKDDIFDHNKNLESNNYALTTALAVSF